MKTSISGSLALALALAALAGCGSPSKLNEPAAAPVVETRSPVAATAAATSPTAVSSPTPQSRVATVDLARQQPGNGAAVTTMGSAAPTARAAAAPPLVPSQRVVYFDFDSFVIKDDFNGLLDGHAKVLAADPARHMVIEGHTDERGGREYNLALGQKRAEAVLRSLTLLGATDKQLEAVSFGEERPAVQGADESAWSRNRRAELKDR
jgi:peptidoglycan-associated lipoprotein